MPAIYPPEIINSLQPGPSEASGVSLYKSQRYTQSCEPKCDLLSVLSQYTLNAMLLPMPIIPGHLNSSGSRHTLEKQRWNYCSILFAWAGNKIMDVKCFLTYKKLHTQVIIIALLTYAIGCKQIQLEKGKSMKKSNGEGRGASNLGQLGTTKLVQESLASSQPEGARRASHSISHSGWYHGEWRSDPGAHPLVYCKSHT